MEQYGYDDAVAYLLRVPRFASKGSFEDVKDFIAELMENRSWGNVIHVAGTNGKGSVCAYVQSVLLKAGYGVGMFTSPHLLRVNERIRINGRPIGDEAFLAAFLQVMEVVERRVKRGLPHPSFFELTFAMALVAFDAQPLDFILLETGLGGRLDATNVVEKPILTAITSISLDHVEFLGETVGEIAGEKAGILKEGVPLIFDGDNEEARTVIERAAEKMNVKASAVFEKNVKLVRIDDKHIDFLYECGYDDSIYVRLRTVAAYQMKNAAIAIEILRYIDRMGESLQIEAFRGIDETVIVDGIESTVWPGRMEWMKPYFLLDGAHNVAGVKEAVGSVGRLGKKVVLLFSAVRDKFHDVMIRELCEGLPLEQIVISGLSTTRGEQPAVLAEEFRRHCGKDIYVRDRVTEAVELAEALVKGRDDVIVFAVGSLYLVSEIREIYCDDQF